MTYELEFETHHHPACGGSADLTETGCNEDFVTAYVELAPRDVLLRYGNHRIPFNGTYTLPTGEIYGSSCEGVGDPTATKALAYYEASD